MQETPRPARQARPLVIAHRGASADEPEHTLAAYKRGIADGTDGIECDVRLTADHHLVCVHDRRVDRTSNGKGIVSALELAQLESLNWGSWKAKGQIGQDETPERDRNMLLTLNSLLTTVTAVDRPMMTLIETKHPSRHSGKVERAVDQALRRFGFDGPGALGPRGHQVRVMSFSYLALQRMRFLNPQVGLVHLVHVPPVWARDGGLPPGVNTLGLDIAVLRRTATSVERFRARGHEVYVWTVDQAADVQRCLDVGVDAIITNRPRFVLDQVADSGYSS